MADVYDVCLLYAHDDKIMAMFSICSVHVFHVVATLTLNSITFDELLLIEFIRL